MRRQTRASSTGGHTGNGTSSHLSTVLINVAAGLDITPVAYPGVPQIMADLIAGRLQLHFGSAGGHPAAGAGWQCPRAGGLGRTPLARPAGRPDGDRGLRRRLSGGVERLLRADRHAGPGDRSAGAPRHRHRERAGDHAPACTTLGIEAGRRTPDQRAAMIHRETPIYERLLTAAGLRRDLACTGPAAAHRSPASSQSSLHAPAL